MSCKCTTAKNSRTKLPYAIKASRPTRSPGLNYAKLLHCSPSCIHPAMIGTTVERKMRHLESLTGDECNLRTAKNKITHKKAKYCLACLKYSGTDFLLISNLWRKVCLTRLHNLNCTIDTKRALSQWQYLLS